MSFLNRFRTWPDSPWKNATSRSSRGNEAQISLETEAICEPPYVGCYFLNRLLTLTRISELALHEALIKSLTVRNLDFSGSAPFWTTRFNRR